MKKKLFVLINKVILYILKKTYCCTLPKKIKKLRSKDKITILFVLSETSKWKTESLYLEMLNHNRFQPIIGITLRTDDKPTESARKIFELKEYLEDNGYDYVELIREGFIQEKINPDIIIYQEPYATTLLRGHNYLHNLNSVFISITYGFHSVLLPFNNLGGIKEFAWFDCYENTSTAVDAYNYTHGKRKNLLVTGLPMSEVLLKYTHNQEWKPQPKKLKKIIWAPHHSIGFNYETITYSTFLSIAEPMKELAIKYKEFVQWSFKPHPLLKYKLELLWGKKKTNEYYEFWEQQTFTQLNEDGYVGLFQQSDALIHDCDSFTIEYLHMNKPCLYLINDSSHDCNLNQFAKKALSVYEHGKNINDIENFITNIINNCDKNKDPRNDFFNRYILSSNTPSQNIINAILGLDEYKTLNFIKSK